MRREPAEQGGGQGLYFAFVQAGEFAGPDWFGQGGKKKLTADGRGLTQMGKGRRDTNFTNSHKWGGNERGVAEQMDEVRGERIEIG